MRAINIYLPIFNWNIDIITLYNKEDKEPLKKLLEDFGISSQDMEEDLSDLESGYMDGGDTWRDFIHKRFVVLIFPWSSSCKFYEILNHEKRHVIDRICEHHHIKDIETPAYIDGYLSSIIYSRLNELT